MGIARRHISRDFFLTAHRKRIPVASKSYYFQENNKNSVSVVVDNVFTTLEDGTSFYTPFWRIDTGKLGPSLLLVSSQHGNEIQGVEVAKRFRDLCASQLVSGSVWILPVANIPAVHKRRHSINLGPVEPVSRARTMDHNMNLLWPGKQEGNDTERLVYNLNLSVLRYCSHLIDMHCYNHFTAAETLSVNDNESSFPMGEVTTTRFINYSTTPKISSAAQLVRKSGGGAIEIELSGQYQMQEAQVQKGLNSLINITRLMGMIKGKPKLIDGKRAIRNADTSYEIKSPSAGLFVPSVLKDHISTFKPEDFIEKGQMLGHIINDRNLAKIPVISPVSGYIWQLGACHSNLCDVSLPAQHPYTEEGERLAMIVTT